MNEDERPKIHTLILNICLMITSLCFDFMIAAAENLLAWSVRCRSKTISKCLRSIATTSLNFVSNDNTTTGLGLAFLYSRHSLQSLDICTMCSINS